MAFLAAIAGSIGLTPSQGRRTRLGVGSGDQQLLMIDCTLFEEARFEAELTSHPVEVGGDITDHIVVKPRRFELEGLVSQEPLQLASAYSENGLLGGIPGILNQGLQAAGAATGAVAQRFGLGSRIGGLATALGGVAGNALIGLSQNPAEETRKILIQYLENKTVFRIVTSNFRYENLVFTSISFPRDPQLGKALRFRASMMEIRFATSKVIEVKPVAASVRNTATGTASLGNQNANPATAAVDQKASLLKQGFDGLGITRAGSGV